MTAAGIVAEYNPFHRGHAFHLARTKEALGPDGAAVCVMSGHWVQRGDCALADKWTRSALALAGGADLVIELPTPWAMASAEAFARGAVGLLAATGVVDVLSFGSEDGDLSPLQAAATALDGRDYPRKLREALSRGLSFPAARQEAAGCPCLSTPNNNLGVEYLRALNALGNSITPMTVARRGAGHDSTGHVDGFASASAIRALLRDGRTEEAAPSCRRGPWRLWAPPPPSPGRSGPFWPSCGPWGRPTGPPARTAARRRGFPPGWCGRHGRPVPWRNSTPWPRPGGTPTPGCGGWRWGPSWA